MQRLSFRLGAGGLAALALSTTAFAGVYYVSADAGDDRGPGSADHPWRSLHRALEGLKPGDRLVVRAGRYREPLSVTASGSPQRPIEILGEGRPLVEADGDAISLSGSYLVLRGFEAHSYGWGSAIAVGKNNHHVQILDNIARDSACGGVAAVQTDYLVIQGNRVFGNARRAPWQCSGVSIYQAVASDLAPGFHNLIRGNVVYDNMNVFVDDKVSHSNGRTTDGNGIIIDDSDHTQTPALGAPYDGGTLIENNLVYDNGGRGVHVFHASNVVVVHNVAYHDLKDRNLQRPAGELSAAFSRGVTMADNIVAALPGQTGLMDAYTHERDRFDDNLICSDQPFLSVESPVQWGRRNLVSADPGFVRPGLGADADFRLRPSSPARGAGAVAVLGGPQLVTLDPSRRTDVGLLGR